MIPRILFRTVPTETSAEVEQFWKIAESLHPFWDLRTYRDPLDPAEWPRTSKHWADCANGAQLAGLIRLEALIRHGGIYIDSDFECYRPFDPLVGVKAFAGWEDPNTVPDAVLGAEENHPAIKACLRQAIHQLRNGAWESGPGVTTRILPGREDVLLLPPGSLYPYHYTERERRHEDHQAANPWAFGAHHWAGSWLR